MQTYFVVEYASLPQYKGLVAYLSGVPRWPTFVSLTKATLFDNPADALTSASIYPTYDEAHDLARVRRVEVETKTEIRLT